jgi:hypothetical protein
VHSELIVPLALQQQQHVPIELPALLSGEKSTAFEESSVMVMRTLKICRSWFIVRPDRFCL